MNKNKKQQNILKPQWGRRCVITLAFNNYAWSTATYSLALTTNISKQNLN